MPNQNLHRMALASVAIALAVLALKLVAWRVTGSVALFSDAAESVVNVAAAGAAYLAIRVADRPADHNHPYGHHKAEYLSAVFEGVLIVLAAIAVLRAAWLGFLAPKAIDAPMIGLAANGLAGLLNAAWGMALIRKGEATGSPALVADGRHLMADVASSVAVIGGLVLALVTGLHILDPLLAALVRFYILWAGWRPVADSLGGLMDEATPPDTVKTIEAVIARSADGAIEVHDLRTRRAGRATFIEFHLVVAGTSTVAAAHVICDRIEAALRREITGSITTIHVEPDNKAKPEDGISLT